MTRSVQQRVSEENVLWPHTWRHPRDADGHLKLARSGRLTRPPTVLRTAGDPDLRAKYGDLLEDQVRRIFAECTPLRLPAELYDTPDGGWNDFTFTYRVN